MRIDETQNDQNSGFPIPQRVIDYFLKKGYKILGNGAYQVALLTPGGLVMKIHDGDRGQKSFGLSSTQRAYIKFIDFCMKQRNIDNPFVPKFYGYEVVNYDNNGEYRTLLLVKTERLFYITEQSVRDILEYIIETDTIDDFDKKLRIFMKKRMKKEIDSMYWLIMHLGKKGLKKLQRTVNAIKQMALKYDYTIDLHGENYMYSSNGDIVVNDPFAND